jgi:PKD repeat protein
LGRPSFAAAGWASGGASALTGQRWDFGDGKSSTERHPVHPYEKTGEFIVTLKAEGPESQTRRTKVRDVTLP